MTDQDVLILKQLLTKYGWEKVLRELARIATAYGRQDEKLKSLSNLLRTSLMAYKGMWKARGV